MNIEFFVAGEPKPKGSLRSFVHSKTGKVVTPRDRKIECWQNRIAAAAYEAWSRCYAVPAQVEAIRLTLTYVMARPRAHYGTGRNAEKLRETAPDRPTGRRGDIDKLERAVLDALTGVVYYDDGQVVSVQHEKWYGTRPGVRVCIEEVPTIDRLGERDLYLENA